MLSNNSRWFSLNVVALLDKPAVVHGHESVFTFVNCDKDSEIEESLNPIMSQSISR